LAGGASEIRARHYHRSSRPVSLADAVLIGWAMPGDRIATADPDVLAVARAERLEVVAARPGLNDHQHQERLEPGRKPLLINFCRVLR
jgi:hypothetical protein